MPSENAVKKNLGWIFLLVAVVAAAVFVALESGKPKGRLILLLCLWGAAGVLEIAMSERLKKRHGQSTFVQGLLFLVFTAVFLFLSRWYWF